MESTWYQEDQVIPGTTLKTIPRPTRRETRLELGDHIFYVTHTFPSINVSGVHHGSSCHLAERLSDPLPAILTTNHKPPSTPALKTCQYWLKSTEAQMGSFEAEEVEYEDGCGDQRRYQRVFRRSSNYNELNYGPKLNSDLMNTSFYHVN
jgi:hypothetical protein